MIVVPPPRLDDYRNGDGAAASSGAPAAAAMERDGRNSTELRCPFCADSGYTPPELFFHILTEHSGETEPVRVRGRTLARLRCRTHFFARPSPAALRAGYVPARSRAARIVGVYVGRCRASPAFAHEMVMERASLETLRSACARRMRVPYVPAA